MIKLTSLVDNWKELAFPATFPQLENVIFPLTVKPIYLNNFNGNHRYVVDVKIDGDFHTFSLNYFEYEITPDTFDFTPLCEAIKKQFNIDNCNIVFENGNKKPIITHDELNIGVFSEAVSMVELSFFNYSFKNNLFWATITLAYEAHGRGCNSMTVLNVYYNLEQYVDGWFIETEKDYRTRQRNMYN